jgi:hypothetical protein
MRDGLFETLTFAAVGVPALVFAIGKAWLALLMYRGTRIRTEIGRWLLHLYWIVAALTLLIGAAYLLTVSDREGLIRANFATIRQGMRLAIGGLYLLGVVASYKLWRAVDALEATVRDRDPDDPPDREESP